MVTNSQEYLFQISKCLSRSFIHIMRKSWVEVWFFCPVLTSRRRNETSMPDRLLKKLHFYPRAGQLSQRKVNSSVETKHSWPSRIWTRVCRISLMNMESNASLLLAEPRSQE